MDSNRGTRLRERKREREGGKCVYDKERKRVCASKGKIEKERVSVLES